MEPLGIQGAAVFTPWLSAKDAAAPTLAEAREAGLLPDYDRCLAYETEPNRGELNKPGTERLEESTSRPLRRRSA